MSEDVIITHCSPTLAGIKTGSLFRCPLESKEDLNKSVSRFNKCFVPKGLRLIPIKYMEEGILMYLYRPAMLEKDLKSKCAKRMLNERKYPINNINSCVVEIVRRFNEFKEYPHEIGLFLGYPSEDVEGFIINHAHNAKCVGTWKVYGNKDSAQKKFAQYKKCKEIYQKEYEKNKSFEKLIVC